MPNQNNNFATDTGNYPVKIVALGGLDEMGKNCYVIELDNDAFIIEAGLKYPTRNIPGVDIIIPDFEYLRTIANKVKGIIITHGHDDQYGALPYLLNVVKAPIIATKTTIAIIQSTYKKNRNIEKAQFIEVKPSSHVEISKHVFELFQTTHSVAESFGFALKTRFGNIVYTSDYITDYSPLKGFQFDLPKVARLSESEQTFLLLTESECADKPGIASPNHKITDILREEFENTKGKIFISIYNQNFYNIQEVINSCKKYRKRIVIADPEQIAFFESMAKIGDIAIPSDMLVSLHDINKVAPNDLVILVSGSGEKLFRYCKEICYGNVRNLKVETTDTWINAAPSVPGTEIIHTDACDTMYRTDCHVVNLTRKQVSSMHAQQEDLKMMLSLMRPKYYMPVKGEYRLLMANAQIAMNLGIGLNHMNSFVFDNGMVLCFDKDGKPIHKIVTVRNGDIMVDGNGVGDVKEAAIEERTKMADGGVVLIGVAVSVKKKKIVSEPDIQMRGFLYLKDSQPVLDQINTLLANQLNNALNSERKFSLMEIEKRISEKCAKSLVKTTEKEPRVIVKVIDVDSQIEIDPR